MLLAILGVIVTGGFTYFALKAADKIAHNDIKRFVKPIVLFFGFAIALAIYTTADAAEPIKAYAGFEAGVDWPHDGALPSPQCVDSADRDQLTSDGRLYVGASQQWGIVTFYGEFDPWRHKSCALVDDNMVYDAYGVKFGARIEFTLFH